MYNIIQADANEPVPPVMTKVFPLKASIICMIFVPPFPRLFSRTLEDYFWMVAGIWDETSSTLPVLNRE